MVVAAVGVHPNSSAAWRSDRIDELRRLASHEKIVAIGEIGLDYYRDNSPKHVQQEAFEAQLALADELSLPVIIHNRQADDDILRRLRKPYSSCGQWCLTLVFKLMVGSAGRSGPGLLSGLHRPHHV